jgi:hypothetical protein
MMMTMNNLSSGQVVSQKSDKWGRWVTQTFQGRKSKQLIVINAFQVVNKTIIPGKITVASQQQSLSIQESASTNNPRTAFRRDPSI